MHCIQNRSNKSIHKCCWIWSELDVLYDFSTYFEWKFMQPVKLCPNYGDVWFFWNALPIIVFVANQFSNIWHFLEWWLNLKVEKNVLENPRNVDRLQLFITSCLNAKSTFLLNKSVLVYVHQKANTKKIWTTVDHHFFFKFLLKKEICICTHDTRDRR